MNISKNKNGKKNIAEHKCLVISGPSGSGKSTIMKRLLNDEDTKDMFRFSVSYTTRKKRPDEIEGKDYFFVTKEIFEKMIEKDEFLEYAVYNKNYYGTGYNEIYHNEKRNIINDNMDSNLINSLEWRKSEKVLSKKSNIHDNRIIILDVDRKGVESLIKKEIDCYYIFIFCDKLELRKRIINRINKKELSYEESMDLENRINEFEKDIDFGRKGVYDLIVENIDIENTVNEIKKHIKTDK